jgi:hypothetical protein
MPIVAGLTLWIALRTRTAASKQHIVGDTPHNASGERGAEKRRAERDGDNGDHCEAGERRTQHEIPRNDRG